jgi:hypothetical protein
MKIRKNGKVITLTESDLKRIVKKTLNEQGVNDGVFRILKKLDDFDATAALKVILKDLDSDIDVSKVMKSIPEFSEVGTQLKKGILALKRELTPALDGEDMKKGMEILRQNISTQKF